MVSSIFASARRIASIRRLSLGGLVGAALVGAPGIGVGNALAAQTTSPQQAAPVPSPERVSPRRQLLDSIATNLERCSRTDKDANRRSNCLQQAKTIRKRLREGDFQAGHRILIMLAGDSALSDTFTVRADQKLQLPNLPEISLAGVLDSELQDYLQTQLARYIRNPTVSAQALLRVSVSGDVGNPGFYSVRTDTPVSDVIMNAGGPASTADINKTELRRGNQVVVNRDGIQTAIRSEMTMSDIGARPGDELFVPSRPSGTRWTKLAAATATITGLVWTVVYIAGRR